MHDAVIVGGGHNALVCGAYMARAGYKALVLERRSIVGGACVTEESWPGFKVSTGAYVMTLLQPRIILDLELKKHGLEVLEMTPTFMPMPGGRAVVFWPDEERLCRELAVFSEKDAAAYPKYREMLSRLTPIIREGIWDTPPNLASMRLADLAKTARFFFKYRKYGSLFYEMYDILTMSAFDYLAKWFESDEVIAALGYYVTGGGTNASMKMPSTAFSCIRPLVRDNATEAGPGGFVRGGMGAVYLAERDEGGIRQTAPRSTGTGRFQTRQAPARLAVAASYLDIARVKSVAACRCAAGASSPEDSLI